jgi:hypothetical protein
MLFFCMIAVSSCMNHKKLNKYISLWRKDKIPYGTYYAFQNLPSIFPKASIITNSLSPQSFYYDSVVQGDNNSTLKAYIIIGPRVVPQEAEVESMIRFAASGHQLFISSLVFGDSLLDALHLEISDSLSRGSGDSLRLNLYEPVNHNALQYIYPGYCRDAYFVSFDTVHTQVLGTNDLGKPDFIRIPYRHGGAIFLHLAPLAFSNFFLLHRQNKSYYDFAFSYLPKETTEVIWDDYFRYEQRNNFSALRFILGNRSLKWAFWLVIFLFLLLYIFDSKRKQRALLSLAPPGNASVDFVRTVARLYLQQKNNHNLALKMITAFLEQVRSAYLIPTSVLNDDFTKKLALRTGRDSEKIRKLVGSIHGVRMKTELTDQELMDLHQQMELINKPV